MALAVLTQPYPARVKEQFWFRELRQAVAVLAEGKSFADLKRMSEEENFFNASSASRANEIRQVLEWRLKAPGLLFVPSFNSLLWRCSDYCNRGYAHPDGYHCSGWLYPGVSVPESAVYG